MRRYNPDLDVASGRRTVADAGGATVCRGSRPAALAWQEAASLPGGSLVLEPQSLLLFGLLLVAFGLLVWWLVTTRRVALKVVAAGLSFVMAMFFGVLTVNRYFGYYTTWGAVAADFSNAGTNSGPQVTQGSLLAGNKSLTFDQRAVYLRLAEFQGYTLRVRIPGKLSHITRQVYIYLPPQYFQTQYAKYRFPVIELIHGQPGAPQDWINVVGVQQTLNELVKSGQAKPAVLVMPDANGGNGISLQCLNQVGGAQDLTYLAQDIPNAVDRLLRVAPPGDAWGIAGYSEGGFCAANMALQYRYRYGYAAALSGYFSPYANKLVNPARAVDPFGNNRALRAQNTPLDEVRALAPGARLPLFWLGAAQGSRADVSNAEYFAQLLQLHEANVPVFLPPGGGHTMGSWHTMVPPMLTWMTDGLAAADAHDHSLAVAKARAQERANLKGRVDPPAKSAPKAGPSSTPTK
jgi:enterochelin esterase-like enzyme